MTKAHQYFISVTLASLGVLNVSGTIADTATASTQTVIEARREGFKKMGAAMKALSDQAKQAAPDLAKMTAASQTISTAAPQQFQWFPAGTGPESGIETDALEHIWQDRTKFESLASKLAGESKTLTATVAGGDLAAIKTQVKAVGEVCSTCHKSFRAD